jgi:uncharacterized protein YdhG (YjbR/CyaY superfamily)
MEVSSALSPLFPSVWVRAQPRRGRHPFGSRLECRSKERAGSLHEIVKASAPELSPKTWYGMPAYAKDGKVVCFFQSAKKFNSRYATFGFSDKANLDEGAMWATSFALKELTDTEEAKLGALVKRAVSQAGS